MTPPHLIQKLEQGVNPFIHLIVTLRTHDQHQKKPAPSHSNSGELVIIDLLVIQKWLDHQPSTNDSADLELFANAIEIVLTSGIGSTSLLQRKLKIGFSRAGYVMDVLEDLGVVGRAEGSKARSVLLKYSDIPRYK